MKPAIRQAIDAARARSAALAPVKPPSEPQRRTVIGCRLCAATFSSASPSHAAEIYVLHMDRYHGQPVEFDSVLSTILDYGR